MDTRQEAVLELKVYAHGERGIHAQYWLIQMLMAETFTSLHESTKCAQTCWNLKMQGGAYNVLSRFLWDRSVIDKQRGEELLFWMAKHESEPWRHELWGSSNPPVSQLEKPVHGKMLRTMEEGGIQPTNTKRSLLQDCAKVIDSPWVPIQK
mmetsp:Transcript_50282/g.75091  ORF Transcript_50282/g.75091 Transcript_50282/m.75091 type:complete len:151 (-) Transcript_50282:131-583(-)